MKDTLNNLSIATEAKIEALECRGSLRGRLLDLGFVPNTKIKPLFKSASGDPTAYEVRSSVIALREKDSANINIMS